MRAYDPGGRLLWLTLTLALTACQEDNEDRLVDAAPTADAAADAEPVADAAPPREDGAPPEVDGAAPDPDMAVADPCDMACETFADCSVELCEGFDEGAHGALVAACAGECAGNPAFATVINGAGICRTVVDFVLDLASESGDEEYPAACRTPDGPLEPDGSECPYPCAEAEVCNQGHCVRPDGTCQTDYHCRLGVQECLEGACVTAQFAECRGEADCTNEEQVCLSFSQNPLDPGNCYVACEGNDDCPVNETCNAQAGNICYFEFCGPGTVNGEVYGQCQLGGWGGICYPLPEGNANAQGTPGVCLEADGDAGLGEACDAQAEGRDGEARALQCSAGLICFGDPDDPRDPEAMLDGQGSCTALCDPRAPACPDGYFCIDFTSPDDPATPDFDDTRHIGACIVTDCDLLDPQGPCGEGRACRAYAATATEGYCADVGDVPPGGPCEDGAECAGVAICGQGGSCVPICDPADQAACGEGQFCFRQPDWVIGFCIDDPADQ